MFEHERVVDAAGSIRPRRVIVRVRALASFDGDHEIAQTLAFCAEANVKRGMAADAAQGQFGGVVSGEDVCDARRQFAGTPGPGMRACGLPLPSST